MIIFAEIRDNDILATCHSLAEGSFVLRISVVIKLVKFLTVGVGRCAGARERRAGLCGPINRRMHEERLGLGSSRDPPSAEARPRGTMWKTLDGCASP